MSTKFISIGTFDVDQEFFEDALDAFTSEPDRGGKFGTHIRELVNAGRRADALALIEETYGDQFRASPDREQAPPAG